MSWKRHLVPIPQGEKLQAALERLQQQQDSQALGSSSANFSSYIPEVYAGPANRLERYQQYDNMDRDPEINSAIDTIADFCTQTEEQEELPFNIKFYEDASEAEVEVLNQALRSWCKINSWRKRIWRLFRNVIVYGDQFFVRDPETFELMWLSHEKVEHIIVNEAEGKNPDQYVVKELDLNIQSSIATAPTKNSNRGMSAWAGITSREPGPVSPVYTSPGSGSARFQQGENSSVVDAEHIVHLSLCEGLDANWPFGNSVLEAVFKPYKQKELLEDAILIYRIQRAPERRVFHIDVGNVPQHKAMEYVNRIKNEIHQRRIPSQTGGGHSIMDAAYNPQSIIEDFFFPRTGDGRGSEVTTLPGGECLTLDTKIELLDGRSLELGKIIEEFNAEKQNWVYSVCPKTGSIVPGPITWAGVTRKNAELVQVTLDNGEKIRCTPDHKFLLRSGEYVEAKDLKADDSLMPYKGEHSVESIIEIDYVEDTGDITVDGLGIVHDFHNFAISAGIFISNSLGEIDDLKYFNNKMLRGLSVPPSYLPFGPDDSSALTFNDGKMGQAYMQEFRFAKRCKRLQNMINETLDQEFKIFCRYKGIQIEASLFDLELHEPQNFSKYRQIEIDAAQIGVFQPLADVKYFSKRFLMKRYLNMSEDDIIENEKMWKEENPDVVKAVEGDSGIGAAAQGVGLGDVGIRPSADEMDTDEMAGEIGDETGLESPISGAEDEMAADVDTGGEGEEAGGLEL